MRFYFNKVGVVKYVTIAEYPVENQPADDE